jgi:hypothetical protein
VAKCFTLTLPCPLLYQGATSRLEAADLHGRGLEAGGEAAIRPLRRFAIDLSPRVVPGAGAWPGLCGLAREEVVGARGGWGFPLGPLQVRVEGGGMRDTHLWGADKGWVGAVFLPLSS